MQKIFFLSGSFPPNTGGEFYNYKIYEYLKKTEETSNLDIRYVNLHRLRFILKLSWIPLIGDIFASLLFAIILIRCQGFIILDHYFSYYLTLTKIINKLFHGKLILIVHHSDRYQSYKKQIQNKENPDLYQRKDNYQYWNQISFINFVNKTKERISLSCADKIITVSEYTKKEITSLDINSQLIEVLPPGLDRGKLNDLTFLNHSKNNDHYQILCVGHCIPRKGIIYLIEALPQIKQQKSNFTLHIVGKTDKDSRYYDTVKNRIEELNLQEYIHIHERVNQPTLNQLYSTADIFVLPSLQEGFGIVFLEAMYYSLPIIATDISAIPELIQHRKNGLLVPPADSESLAEAILLLIENTQLKIKMGQYGKQLVDTSYCWEQTSSKFLSVVQSLVNG